MGKYDFSTTAIPEFRRRRSANCPGTNITGHTGVRYTNNGIGRDTDTPSRKIAVKFYARNSAKDEMNP